MSGGAGGTRPVTEVAVGVLVRADGAVLLADRPAGKPYAGYWEFPGGKVEPGETIAEALVRELDEELGVQIRDSAPWVVMEYDYPHAYVRLHFRRIHEWTGVPRPVEGQQLHFLTPGDTPPAPLLPAALPALRWIQLPTITGLSPQTATDAQAARNWMQDAMARGLRQVIWYEPLLSGDERIVALQTCRALAQIHGARFLVDARMHVPTTATAVAAIAPGPPGDGAGVTPATAAAPGDGVYLGADELRVTIERPAATWLGAGIRTPGDLARAMELACDFVVLESDAAELCRDAPLPAYVPSQLGLEPLRIAQCAGAHGLAVTIGA